MKYYLSVKESELDRNKKLSWSILYIITPTFGFFSIYHYMNANYQIAAFNGILCLVQIINMMLVNKTKAFKIANRANGLFLSLHFLNNIVYGGNSGSFIMWVIIFPCAMFIFFSFFEAILWSSGFLAAVILLLTIFKNTFMVPDFPAPIVNRVMTIYVMMVFIMITLERFRLKLHYGFLYHENQLNQAIARSEHAKKQAEEAAELKGRFLATMSHEIRNPLSIIIGMTDLILLEESQKKKDEYLKIIKDSSSHLNSLINDVLDYSRIEEGRIELHENIFRIHELLENIYRSFGDLFKNKGIDWHMEIDTDIPSYLKGDSIRLRQVLTNIINNAHKYTDTGKVLLRVNKNNYQEQEKENIISLKFLISDTGSGISGEFIDDIFNIYSQVKTSRSADSGVGLGLAISKKIIEAMGGTIQVNSIIGEGSAFQIELPFEIENNTSQAIDSKDTAQEAVEKYSILVAEDNVMIQSFLSKALSKLGFNVTTESDGEKALMTLQQNNFDLILLDIEMPVMNGIETAERIRFGKASEKNKNIPIVALTGNAEFSNYIAKHEDIFDSYIKKPVNLATLDKTLKKIIESK